MNCNIFIFFFIISASMPKQPLPSSHRLVDTGKCHLLIYEAFPTDIDILSQRNVWKKIPKIFKS